MGRMLKSRAFWAGFADGFSAPYRFAFGSRRIAVRQADIVALSWQQVGASMRAAMAKEGAGNDKIAKPKRREKLHA